QLKSPSTAAIVPTGRWFCLELDLVVTRRRHARHVRAPSTESRTHRSKWCRARPGEKANDFLEIGLRSVSCELGRVRVVEREEVNRQLEIAIHLRQRPHEKIRDVVLLALASSVAHDQRQCLDRAELELERRRWFGRDSLTLPPKAANAISSPRLDGFVAAVR